MSENTPGRPTYATPRVHAKRIGIALAVIGFGYLAWFAVGATQCLERGGTISYDDRGWRCGLDFSGR